MTSLLTPTWSEVDHAKTSLFLSRNANSSACSSGPVLVLMHIALSGTLESKGTFLNSPSASMAFLYYARASALRGKLIVGIGLVLLARNAHSYDWA
jgi:hypothetical protein